MRDDFNVEGMKNKIEKNVDAGHTIESIKSCLRQDLIKCNFQVGEHLKCAAALQDQIEYMDKNY